MMLTNEEMLARLVLSAVIGCIIGFEREIRKMPAGMRTHALVCLGSTVFTLSSFAMYGPNVDITRIAAQVATGIGFIGGGAIFKAEDRIKGLTTAANLWVTASLGLVVGFGLFYIAIATTVLVLIVLIIGKFIEKTTLRHPLIKKVTRFKR